jgi:hypothetical protein
MHTQQEPGNSKGLEFGNLNRIQNIRLLPTWGIDTPVYPIAISNYGNESFSRGPPVIASSDGQYFNAQADEIDSVIGSVQNSIWISENGQHMVYLGRDDGQMSYWDLTKSSLHPYKTIQLPSVSSATRRHWKIHGQETVIRDRSTL